MRFRERAERGDVRAEESVVAGTPHRSVRRADERARYAAPGALGTGIGQLLHPFPGARERFQRDVVGEELGVGIGDAVECLPVGRDRQRIDRVARHGDAQVDDAGGRALEVDGVVTLGRVVGVEVSALVGGVVRLDVLPQLRFDGAAALRHVAREAQRSDLAQTRSDVDDAARSFHERVVHALGGREDSEREHLVDARVPCEEMGRLSRRGAVHASVGVGEKGRDGRRVRGDFRGAGVAEVAEVEPLRVEMRIDALLREELRGGKHQNCDDMTFHHLPSFEGSYATRAMENGQRRETFPTTAFSSFSSTAPTK